MSKIVVTKKEKKIITCRYEGFELERISVSDEGKQSLLGNIYVGKVKNIVKNINAAFVEIADEIMCYLELRDNAHPMFLNTKKDDVVKQGDEILVEVIKEAQGTKDIVVTTSVGIKGENIILTYDKNFVGISNKIKDSRERQRLENCLAPYVTSEYGFIVRTKAAEICDEMLVNEAKELAEKYKDMVSKAKFLTCFSCVYNSEADFIKDIREMLDKNTQEIVIEDDNLFADVSSLLEGSSVNLRHYSDPTLPLDKLYSVETNIEALLKEKVWLKSGGNIIIQHTEALTVVDVNTSKAIKIKGESEKTFLKVNLEAAKEIAKQISLRNIGGIIIVDFINMKERKNIQTLVEAFRKELGKDYVKADVVDVTKLNLVEVTRQKIKVPLRRQLRDI